MHDPSTVVFSGGGTGGHLYPALALAEELVNQRTGIRPVFIGASKGIESEVLPDIGLEYELLPVSGWKRDNIFANLRTSWSLLKATFKAVKLHREYKSDLVVVTGGYAGAPAGLAAVLLGIPLVLQEQNAYPGVTTRILSLWAKEVHVAFPESVDRLPFRARDRALISGCPIQPPSKFDSGLNHNEFGLDADLRVLLVTGGSQGSVDLNQLIWEGLESESSEKRDFFAEWQILWITGVKNFEAIDRKVSEAKCPTRIMVVPYVDKMVEALKITDMAISRAGAMSTSEFLAWGIPSILIPLPTAAANHQELNALAIENSGAGLCLIQSTLNSNQLWKAICQIAGNDKVLTEMSERALKNGKPEATSRVISSVLKLLSKSNGSWS